MSILKVEKVISAVPALLIPDTVYFVRTGAGFDLKVTDNTGATAHELNISNGGGGVPVGGTTGQVLTKVNNTDFNTEWATFTALQVGAQIPWTDVTNKPTFFSGTYADLAGIPSTFNPTAHNQAWSTITATPTTLAGYGITNAQPLATVLTNTTASFTTILQAKLDSVDTNAKAITVGTTAPVSPAIGDLWMDTN
jgi:hypothetical protein